MRVQDLIAVLAELNPYAEVFIEYDDVNLVPVIKTDLRISRARLLRLLQKPEPYDVWYERAQVESDKPVVREVDAVIFGSKK